MRFVHAYPFGATTAPAPPYVIEEENCDEEEPHLLNSVKLLQTLFKMNTVKRICSVDMWRPPKEEERMINFLYGSNDDVEIDEFASIKTFSKLITIRDRLKPPKKRPVTWLLRLIEEIYDARFIHDSQDFREDGSSVPEISKSRLSHQFPIFVVDFFSKRYGLRTLVDQNCWELLFNVNLYRETSRGCDFRTIPGGSTILMICFSSSTFVRRFRKRSESTFEHIGVSWVENPWKIQCGCRSRHA